MDTNEKVHTSLSTLANAGELAVNVIQKCLGNDVADTVEGQPILRSTILNLVFARIQADKVRFLGVQ